MQLGNFLNIINTKCMKLYESYTYEYEKLKLVLCSKKTS